MKKIYGLRLGFPPSEDERAFRLIEAMLSYRPKVVLGCIEKLPDEATAKTLAIKLSEAGLEVSAGMYTEYSRRELDKAELLCIEVLNKLSGCSVRQTKPDAKPTCTDPIWERHDEPLIGTLYLDYECAGRRDLLVDYGASVFIASKALKDYLEQHQVSGLRYEPLQDVACDRPSRKVRRDIGYYAMLCTFVLPPLDHRVLVTPWKVPEGQSDAGWNFPVISEYYYSREQIEYCDVNLVRGEELGKRILPTTIVSQRFRKLLSQWGKFKVKFEPVYIVGKNETVFPAPKSWSWKPPQPIQEVIPLEEARKKYLAP
jgi:hypothetical protein